MIAQNYFNGLLSRIYDILHEDLVGLYLTGSASMDDFITSKSDFDVIGVVARFITEEDKNKLEQSLKHDNFHCPAEGLDIVLMTKENAKGIKQNPEYEFWYSTGANWPVISWESGTSSEMSIFLELCRQHGITIYGERPAKLISPINTKILYLSFKEIIEWHRNHILDEYHDPKGQNSVLNACRILKFVESKKLYSKTEGGNLYLQDSPESLAVKRALAIRGKIQEDKIERNEILELLNQVENKLNEALDSSDYKMLADNNVSTPLS